MSSFFDESSLCLIPSGYKDQKIYSVKPTDGSGDLTFSRASSATRVASNGLIEKVRTNLALYSEQFNDAYWVKSNVSVTSNTTANPVNGASTADTLTRTGGGSGFLSKQIAQTGIVTFSIYAKSGSTNFVRLNTYDGSADRGATYNLTTGAITSPYGSPLFTTSQALSNGWYRISISVNAASYADCQVQIDSLNSVIIFGAQLETGDIATDYIATTSAAVSVGPVSGVPRLDYLGSTCPKILLEPQRTNLALYSEQFDNAAWTNASTTITANYGVSPDGYTNADRFQQTTVGALQRTISVSASTSYTVSFYCKLLGGTSASLGVYNFNANTFIFQDNLFSSLVLNQWVRVTRTFTTPVGCTSITGELWRDSTIDCLVYGFQMEQGAYATSYIPTLGTSVTRVADAASKTGISSLIGQTEGTIYWQVSNISQSGGNGARFFTYADGNNFILINPYGTTLRILVVSSGTAFDNYITISGDAFKIAVAYKANDYKFYVNGASVGTPAVTSVPAMSAIGIVDDTSAAATTSQSKTSQLLLFKTRLTNAQLAELTTL